MGLVVIWLGSAVSSYGAAVWTAGHGDLEVVYEDNQWEVAGLIGAEEDGEVEPGIVDGVEVADSEFELGRGDGQLIVATSPSMVTSPNPALTGGSSIFILPQLESDAAALGAPFMGLGIR